MRNKKILILILLIISILSISVVSAADMQSEDIAIDDDSSIQVESNEIDYVVEDSNLESVLDCDINEDSVDLESVSNLGISEDSVDLESVTKSKTILSDGNDHESYGAEPWDGNDDHWDDYLSQLSDPKARLQPKIVYYDPSGKYSGETYEYDWDDYFYGYLRIYKGSTLIFQELMDGCGGKVHSLKGMLTSNGHKISLGTYYVKVEDTDGKVWASSTIQFIKSSVRLTDSRFYAYAGKTFNFEDYFEEGYRSDIDEGLSIRKASGTVKITINGKTYSKYVKNGNFKIKIKVPSKVKTYNCKITFSGSSLFNSFSSTFKLIAKKEPTKIVTKKFKGVAGKKYTLKLVVKNKETGSLIKSGRIKFTFKGKKYNLKVKNGVAKVKIKMPKTAKTYKFKMKYIGTKLTKSSSKQFKIIVKKPKTKAKAKAKKKSNLKSLTLKVSSNTYHSKTLKNGDSISTFYSPYDGQYSPGVHVEAGYNKYGPDYPRHTKLVKAKVWFKNSNGKVTTRTVKRKGYYIKISRVTGYSPYKAKIWYKKK